MNQDEQALAFILEKGILAPSADNLQPWKFKVHGRQIDLFLDATRIASYCDAGWLAPYLSAGAVIENMRVAATRYAWALRVSYFPARDNPLKVATMEFLPGPRTEDPHLPALDRRVTCRKFYDRAKAIPEPVYAALNQTLQGEEGVRLLAIRNGTKEYRTLTRLIAESDKIRFENERLHREFFAILRFGPTEACATRDGLSVASLDAGPLAPWMFALLRSWRRMAFLNHVLGMSKTMGSFARLQMESSQDAFLLVAPGRSPLDFVRGGACLERLWHEMTRHGLSLQPMEGLPIFIIDLQTTGGHDLSPAQKSKIESLRDEFFSLLGIGDQHGLLMLLRAGFSAPPGARTLRRPLEDFLLPR